MMVTVNSITRKNGTAFAIEQKLNCTNFGIYATQCIICSNFDAGQ